ncbi:MAG: 30S ribosome-binding factor RbfA [Clostridia bacterium]|nr:30S ribosome-binding factor RbfA [Clostridia bacterium]
MKRRNSGVSRNDRLNGEFQKEIYEIISRKLKNPLVTEMFSVLRVDSSRDLSYAKVYISVYSKDEFKRQQTFKAIEADAKKIRFELAKVIRARTVPELKFILDDSMEYGDKMEKLFKSINEGENK